MPNAFFTDFFILPPTTRNIVSQYQTELKLANNFHYTVFKLII